MSFTMENKQVTVRGGALESQIMVKIYFLVFYYLKMFSDAGDMP